MVTSKANVSTAPKAIQLDFDPDERFAAAAGGVARYLADDAGLASAAVAELHAAVVEACRELFEPVSTAPPLRVSYTRFPDRIEIAVFQPGQASTGGLTPADATLGRLFPGVERVEYNNSSGESVILLTRYLSAP
jgi:hypothetical protein